MLHHFNRISIQYGIAFASLALSLVFVVIANFTLVNSVKSRMVDFGGVFNVAISEVLNADRDLYQARIAEVALLSSDTSAQEILRLRAEFEENAEQALERIHH